MLLKKANYNYSFSSVLFNCLDSVSSVKNQNSLMSILYKYEKWSD